MNTELQHQAWRRMFTLRTCPPINVLKEGGEQVSRHLASCSDCRETLENSNAFAKAGKLLVKLPRTHREPTEPVPGEIRRIQPEQNSATLFDANGRYHNPPLVLILNRPDDMNLVRVAQVFEEEDLCDSGDVSLGEFGFAEAWNIYSVPVTLLAKKAYRRVDKDVVDEVLEASQQHFPALDPRSVLFNFRSCEVETGSFFAAAATFSAFLEWEAEKSEQPAKIISFRDKCRAIFAEQEKHWNFNIEQLAMAAADNADLDPRADKHYRLPCLVCTIDAKGNQQRTTLPCNVDIFINNNAAECYATLSLPKRYIAAEALICCEDWQCPAEVTWEDDTKVSIAATFPTAVFKGENLHFHLLLAEGAEN